MRIFLIAVAIGAAIVAATPATIRAAGPELDTASSSISAKASADASASPTDQNRVGPVRPDSNEDDRGVIGCGKANWEWILFAFSLPIFSILLQWAYVTMQFKKTQRRRLDYLRLMLPKPEWLYIKQSELDAMNARLTKLEELAQENAQISAQMAVLTQSSLKAANQVAELTQTTEQMSNQVVAMAAQLQLLEKQYSKPGTGLTTSGTGKEPDRGTYQMLPESIAGKTNQDQRLPLREEPNVQVNSGSDKTLRPFLLKYMRELATVKTSITQVNIVPLMQKIATQQGVSIPENIVNVNVLFYDTSGIVSPNTYSLVAMTLGAPRSDTRVLVFPHPQAGRIGQFKYWFNNFDATSGKIFANKPAIGRIDPQNKLTCIELGHLSES